MRFRFRRRARLSCHGQVRGLRGRVEVVGNRRKLRGPASGGVGVTGKAGLLPGPPVDDRRRGAALPGIARSARAARGRRSAAGVLVVHRLAGRQLPAVEHQRHADVPH